MLALLVGFAFGYLGSMPVAGPISVLVLHLGLAREGRRAFHLALGGALAEGIYALLAFWGLSAILAGHPLLLPDVDRPVVDIAQCLAHVDAVQKR